MYAFLVGVHETEGARGLGITDTRLTATAFESKWLWLQKVDSDRAWAELPLRASREAVDFFIASTYTVIGNGERTMFWTDRWLDGRSVRQLAPTVSALVPAAVRRS